MLSMLILLLLQGNFTALRLGAQGSFPKPLSAQEERRATAWKSSPASQAEPIRSPSRFSSMRLLGITGYCLR